MRYSTQSTITIVLAGCLLVLLVLLVGPTAAPTPAAPRGSVSLTHPESAAVHPTFTPALLTPTQTPSPTLATPAHLVPLRGGGGQREGAVRAITPELDAPGDAGGELPDARPPRRPASLASVAGPAPGVGAPSATSMIHRVEAGDTVYDLASQYGASPEAILDANGLDEQSARFLDIGQELVVPFGPEGGGGGAPALTPGVVHRVQAGEALIIIARDYGTTVESIVAANGLADAELILAGQELIVPQNPLSNPPSLDSLGITPTREREASPTLAPAAERQLAPTALISPTSALTQTAAMTRSDTVETKPQTDATEPIPAAEPLPQTDTAETMPQIGAAEPLTHTVAITGTVPTEPATATAEIAQASTATIIETAPTEVVTATAEITQAPAAAAQAEASPAAELAGLEEAMVEAVNAERVAHGLPAYRVDEVLAGVARAHALDMAVRDYTGHTSPEGKEVRDRLRDAGLDLDRAGENYYVSTRPAQESVAHTLGWFMGHPSHRDNILHDYYTRIGVGVAYKPPGWYIFVLDFVGE